MLDADIRKTIELVHDSPVVAVMAVAGAGGEALAWLLSVAGASRTLLEAIVPYGPRSMVELIGREPEQYVSAETAKLMARACYLRGLGLRTGEEPVVGLSCTATIATDRPKKGEHRGIVCTWDHAAVSTYNVVLEKGRRDRSGEERLVSRLVIHALAQSCNPQWQIRVELGAGDTLDTIRTEHG